MEWAKKNSLDLQQDYKELIKNETFKAKLTKCYEKWYFIYSSYAWVTLRSLEKEFELIRWAKIPEKTPKADEKKRTSEQKEWIEYSQYFSYIRDFRKEVQQKIFYYQAEVLEKIASITWISRHDLEFLQPDEYYSDFFSDLGKVKKLIDERKKWYIYIVTTKGKFFLEWELANDIHTRVFPVDNDEKITEIAWSVAYRGKYIGRARIIFDTHKDNDFSDWDVLVTWMTSPNFISLMKKAWAIITDAGGVTCHAAIVSRELKKPCIIWTKNATQVLKDGDLIEVDADNGIVKILEKNS